MVVTVQRLALDMLPAHIPELDDWKGVAARAERRRIQNRVNQRAARSRKRAEAKHDKSESSQVPSQAIVRRVTEDASLSSAIRRDRSPDFWQMFYHAMATVPSDRSRIIRFAPNVTRHPVDAQSHLKSFENWMHLLTGSPGRDCLFTLIQFNIFRSMVSNERDLGLPEACTLDDDAISPISDASYAPMERMPPSLRPTALQTSTEHHPWIDLLPFPRLRDNLLRAGDSYDETALCTAILGCGSDSGRTGMIVWGEAWDPAGWEFTDEFVRDWRWTLDGCQDFVASTNHWRRRRGKKTVELDDLCPGW